MNASSAQPPCDAQQPCDQASASAPGSLMLFGEHAVLHGHLAIACSIDPRVTVRVHRRADGDVHVSSALGECQSAMRAPDTSAPFQFLMTAVTDFAKQLPGGVTVHVQSEFRADMGLGSSAAVTVATYAALDCLCGTRRVQDDLLMRCRAIVRRVQGRGSGTDVAASIVGGVVAYRCEPMEIRRIAESLPLHVAYSGSKEKTAVVIAKVEALRAESGDMVTQVFREMDDVARAAEAGIVRGDWRLVGDLLNRGQERMEAIGVSTPSLEALINGFRGTPGIVGAKISGSGLGDCVIGLGAIAGDAPFALLPIQVSARGVEVTRIC